ncbi:hypothetical protein G4B11_000471 [Aspergillus flavus]|nr:hypothetical protein G4B11_000471 [Aspergillus flavus]
MLHASDRASQLFVQDENGRVRPVFLRESSQTLTYALLQYPLYIDLCEALPHDIAGIRGLRGKATDYEDIISHPQAIQLPSTFVLSNLPVDNYFYSDYNAADQVCPRLIVAWPGGNSGVCAYVAPQNGANGSLGIPVTARPSAIPCPSVYKSGMVQVS